MNKNTYFVLLSLFVLTWIRGVRMSDIPAGTEAGKFFIYDLPERTVDTWPPSNLTLAKYSIYDHRFRLNEGAGPLIDDETGMYGTWQFSLFKLVYHRLVRHPLRTYDPAEATIFFVPYDGGLDATVSAWDGRSLKARCPRSGIVSGYLTHNSTAQTYLRRNGGSDHFIIFSVIQGVSSLSSPGCRRLYREVCKGCRKLAIEVSYHRGDLPVTTSGKASKVYSYDPTWVSVPYPSSFHYTERVKRAAWVSADDSTEIHNHLDKNHRVTHAIYIGGMHTANKMSNILRRQLAESCNAVEDRECTWIAMGKAGARYSAADVLKQYESSTFCLHPPGDSPTRKGIFDSLLAGCIPVVFDKYTFGDQYTWHIRRADIHEVSVYVPPKDHATFLQFLGKIEPARVKAIQKRIARIAFSLQYSLPPTGPAARVWSPPKQDAVDLILVGMAGQPTRRER